MNHSDAMSSSFVIILLLALCILFLLLFFIFLYVRSKTHAEQDYIDSLEETHAIQRKFYEELLYSSHQMHLLRHDMKNHLQTVQHLLADDPNRAAAYLQQLERSLQVQCATDASQSAFSYFLAYRRHQAEDKNLTLQITSAAFDHSFSQDVSYALLILHTLDLAITHALPGSQITLSPQPDCSTGFCLSFHGTLSRKELRQWEQLNAPLCGSGQISPSLQKGAANISVIFLH